MDMRKIPATALRSLEPGRLYKVTGLSPSDDVRESLRLDKFCLSSIVAIPAWSLRKNDNYSNWRNLEEPCGLFQPREPFMVLEKGLPAHYRIIQTPVMERALVQRSDGSHGFYTCSELGYITMELESDYNSNNPLDWNFFQSWDKRLKYLLWELS